MILDFSKKIILNPTTEFEKQVSEFVEEWFSDSKTVKVQTSGSTGVPKILEVEKERMLNSAKMTCDILGLKKGDSALLCLPIEYISGKMMVVRAIERKLKLGVKTPSTKPLDNLNQHIDFCAMSPLQVESSLDQLYLIKNLILGGASVSETLKTKITQKLKNSKTKSHIYETYGMSETLSHIALKEIYPISKEFFTVLNSIKISLDERNCLHLFAPKLNPKILKTNDLVEIKNDKEFKFLGRIDYIINSGGLKIYPEELENLVQRNIPNEVVFLGKKDELLGEKLVLVVEGEESEEIRNQISNIKYPTKNQQPKEIIFLKKFPRLPNGKINRRELINLYQ